MVYINNQYLVTGNQGWSNSNIFSTIVTQITQLNPNCFPSTIKVLTSSVTVGNSNNNNGGITGNTNNNQSSTLSMTDSTFIFPLNTSLAIVILFILFGMILIVLSLILIRLYFIKKIIKSNIPSSSSQSIILTNGAGVNNPHSARIYPLPITTSTTTPTTTANNGFESRRTNIPSNHNGLLVVEHLQ